MSDRIRNDIETTGGNLSVIRECWAVSAFRIGLVELFQRVLKRAPPDKSEGAWPSVQEKTTGIGNVGKSPCGGTNDEHQSLKVQGSPRTFCGS